MKRHPDLNWAALSDEHLIEIKTQIYDDAKTPAELRRKDNRLHYHLRARNLLDCVFQNRDKELDWTPISNEKVLEIKSQLYSDLNITQLARADGALQYQIEMRDLNAQAFPNYKKPLIWKKISNEQVLEIVRQVYANATPHEVEDKDHSLYMQLSRRKLLDVAFPVKREMLRWLPVTNEQVLQIKHILYEDLGSEELMEEDKYLYGQIMRRKLQRIAFPNRVRKKLKWTELTDEQILTIKREVYDDLSSSELGIADHRLYNQIRYRKLYDRAFPDAQENVNWIALTNEQMLTIVHRVYETLSPTQLENADDKLYAQLIIRKLTKQAFPPGVRIDCDWDALTDEQMLTIRERCYENLSLGELRVDRPFMNALKKRKYLFERIFPNRRKFKNSKWRELTDEQCKIIHSMMYADLTGSQLRTADKPFYDQLIQRKMPVQRQGMIEAVFFDYLTEGGQKSLDDIIGGE